MSSDITRELALRRIRLGLSTRVWNSSDRAPKGIDWSDSAAPAWAKAVSPVPRLGRIGKRTLHLSRPAQDGSLTVEGCDLARLAILHSARDPIAHFDVVDFRLGVLVRLPFLLATGPALDATIDDVA